MDCPKCGFVHADVIAECARCGVIVERYLRLRATVPVGEAATPFPVAAIRLTAGPSDAHDDARETAREVYVRAFAVPVALLVAMALKEAMPFLTRLIAMWIHEGGHALSAWLSSYFAFPGPWATPVGSERSAILAPGLAALLLWGAVVGWQRARWFWVAAAAAGIAVTLYCSYGLTHQQAQQFIIFSGDGGSFAIGTTLMLTMYARNTHKVRRDGLRWAFLVIGAMALADARGNWSGNVADIPFGEDNRGLSDPSVLVEEFNWSLGFLMGRYAQVSSACLAVLAVVYLVGLVRTMRHVPNAAAIPARDAPPRPRS
jgi:hypothetical protein